MGTSITHTHTAKDSYAQTSIYDKIYTFWYFSKLGVIHLRKELVSGVDVAALLHNGYLLLFREEGGVSQAVSLSPDSQDGDD